ncbi:MAG: nickel-dependent hydrogenase large subunit [Campylobacterales bacterium]|nr:nickel-dependent hydrogenase large subunit [Campylobacterales bacterium]
MKPTKIVIDPITRIEGHLRVEIEIDHSNTITQAWVSGQLFRGIETILQNRDPRDAGLLAGRICGVCTNSHFKGAISCVENAYGIKIPSSASILRDLVALSLFVQDHVVHFYHLHLLDYVDVAKALDADPSTTSTEALKYHQKPFRNSPSHYESILQKIKKLVSAGRLGPFNNSYSNHPKYLLNPEQNLILLSHYLEALKFQTNISKAIAIFAGKTPHPQSYVVGGITSVADMLNPQRINDFIFIIKEAKEFVNRAYIPDMKLLCEVYKEEITNRSGQSNGNFLCSGGFETHSIKLFEEGVIWNHNFQNIDQFDPSKITEHVDRAWYNEDDTINYTDFNTDGTLKTKNSDDKYSWIKAPRYNDMPMETGPLARILITYLQGNKLIKPFVDQFLYDAKLTLNDLSSSIGRNAARAIETEYILEYIFILINDLLQNISYYDTKTFSSYDFEDLQHLTNGQTFFEVPRGMLSHLVKIENQKIKNYSVIAPTTWNATPKNIDGKLGAYEHALIGLTLVDPSKPLEVLRVLHSFDPCIACAVHIIDTKGKNLSSYKI